MTPDRSSTSNDRIKELIADLGLSQIDFCNKTGIKASALSNYLKGNRIPRQDALSRIADAFNVSPAWLMGYNVPRVLPQDTVQVRHLNDQADIDRLEIHGSADRLELYGALLLAADGCEPEQIKPIIEALRAMSKANGNNLEV